jgi:two-component system, chemotaxis family, chemotaxis protein CheY
MKILLVDDSRLSRKMLRRALGEGYHYIEAEDGMSGLEQYFLERPDFVILDLTMPGVNGLDVLARLREFDPDSKVIIGTADIQEETRRLAEELGALGFLNKPFSDENVRSVIQKHIDDHLKNSEAE